MLSLLQSAGNRLLQLDPGFMRKLNNLHGKVICIEFDGVYKKVYLLPNEDGIEFESEIDRPVDVTIKGSPVAFVASAIQNTNESDFDKLGLHVSGDMELAQDVSVLFQQLEIDWEEQLSRVTGDFPARKIGNLFRHFSQWRQQATNDLAQNMGEYLQQERRDLATQSRVEKFVENVDDLRADVDRMTQRVQKLTAKLTK
ncbi:MAG: SCP2 sterol-binding domain-containing protein [Gammaproteobacteria bacterium]|nr:SCP2 sterol-binding domain-containing protein [Gammaproteobacteria bacterium]